jgi:hypothetical protein
VKTNSDILDFAFGQASLNMGGKKQFEQGPILESKREGLDQKERMDQKVTEDALQKKLF